MKSLWNGENINSIFRILAGIFAIASLVIFPSIAMTSAVDFSLSNYILGFLCYIYVVAVFASVSIRGKAPTGVVPWK
jgi:hypothetical protein